MVKNKNCPIIISFVFLLSACHSSPNLSPTTSRQTLPLQHPHFEKSGLRQNVGVGGFKVLNQNPSISQNLRTSVIPKTLVEYSKKDKVWSTNFSISENDLQKTFLLNIENGLGKKTVKNAIIKINGEVIIDSDDLKVPPKNTYKQLRRTIKQLKKHAQQDKWRAKRWLRVLKKCKDFFSNTKSNLSLELENLNIGTNTLEVIIKSPSNSSLSIGLDAFEEAANIPGAVHSLIPDDPSLREASYYSGTIGLKLREGLKARINQNSPRQAVVDESGVDLQDLNDLLAELNITLIQRSFTHKTPEEFDQNEQELQLNLSKEIPNMNLFFNLQINSSTDPWPIIDQLREHPLVEEAFPIFVPSQTSFNGASTLSNWKKNLNAQGISDEINSKNTKAGGEKDVRIALLDWGFTEHNDLPASQNFPESIAPNVHLGYFANSVGATNSSSSEVGHGMAMAGIIWGVPSLKGNEKGFGGGLSFNVADPIGIDTYTTNQPSACNSFRDGPCKDPTVNSIYWAIEKGANIIVLQAAHPNGYTIEQGWPLVRSAIIDAIAEGKTVVVPAGNTPCEEAVNKDLCFDKFIGKQNHSTMYNNTLFIHHNLKYSYQLEFPGPSTYFDTGSILVGIINSNGKQISSKFIQDRNLIITPNLGASKPENNFADRGIDVSATDSGYSTLGNESEKYISTGGTSAGAAAIGAIAALMMEADPSLKADPTSTA